MYGDDEKVNLFLDSLPTSPVPRGFTGRVMARLSPRPQPFHLSFLDLVLPAFLGLFFSMVLVAAAALILLPGPFWLIHLQLELKSFFWSLPEGSLEVAVIAAASALAGLIFTAGAAGFFYRIRNS
jgi:hypothetical protein